MTVNLRTMRASGGHLNNFPIFGLITAIVLVGLASTVFGYTHDSLGGDAHARGSSLKPPIESSYRIRRESVKGRDSGETKPTGSAADPKQAADDLAVEDGEHNESLEGSQGIPTTSTSIKPAISKTERPLTSISPKTTSLPVKGRQSTTSKSPSLKPTQPSKKTHKHETKAPRPVLSHDEHSSIRPSTTERPSNLEKRTSTTTKSTQSPSSGHDLETTKRLSTRNPSRSPSSTSAPSTNLPIIKATMTSKAPTIRPNVSFSTNFERDVTYFLDSHPSHNVHDPRAYFTEERTTRSLAIMLREIEVMPKNVRFSFIVRVFAELGRKIASKLTRYSNEVVAVLSKLPDQLGNKPEVSMLVDVVDKAFDSKDDADPRDGSAEDQRPENEIASRIGKDKDKATLFDASLHQLAVKFTRMINFFASKGCDPIMNKTLEAAEMLVTALSSGANGMIKELNKSDKYYVSKELVNITNQILKKTSEDFKSTFIANKSQDDPSIMEHLKSNKKELSFLDLNAISDKTGLIGPWNSHLFANLGSAERVIKLFASLLSRVPVNSKSKWINMYWSQVDSQLDKSIAGFVSMQLIPRTSNSSEMFLLNPLRMSKIVPGKLPEPRKDYLADKNRLPARCYLAGRRWRLILYRAMREYPQSDMVMKKICDKISSLKSQSMNKDADDSFRLCLPRLEIGLRGWGIDGDPNAESAGKKSSIKSPLGDLGAIEDPFIAGARLGFNIGFKIGYNEKRNATLEMEQMNSAKKTNKDKASAEVHYLAAASYRQGATAGARRAFNLAVKEGYLTTLKVSLRAGIRIPAETGSRIASVRCTNFGGQAGLEAGRTVVNRYLTDKDYNERVRKNYIKLGETHGLLGGGATGEAIGAIVGKEAAEEAYKRSIIRGGKVVRAKFYLDEYEAGASAGFERGFERGARLASSSTLDPSAPKFLRLLKPTFDSKNVPASNEVDHWEKDLIPQLSADDLDLLHLQRNHTVVSGLLRGVYKLSKEVKRGLNRMSYTNTTYNLDVLANGFIANDIAYLSLNGSINNLSFLRGFLVVRDLFSD